MSPELIQFLVWACNGLGMIVCSLLWINFRDLRTAHETLKTAHEKTVEDLHEYKLHVSENYASQPALAAAMLGVQENFKAMFVKLDKISDKLDSKQDKV